MKTAGLKLSTLFCAAVMTAAVYAGVEELPGGIREKLYNKTMIDLFQSCKGKG